MDQATLKDSAGKPFGAEIRNVAKAGKIGEVSYMYKRPGSTEQEPKVGLVTRCRRRGLRGRRRQEVMSARLRLAHESAGSRGGVRAEESAYATAYNSAKARHPDRAWPYPRLFDFLNLVVRNEPALSAVRSGSKHRAEDGLGAMVGA